MIKIPFDLYTLKFFLQDQEELYDCFINPYRVKNFKLYTILTFFLCLLFLMIFLIESQSEAIILMNSAASGLLFLLFIFSNKLAPYLKYLNFFLLLFHIVFCSFVAKHGDQIPQFIYGVSTLTLALPMLYYSDFRIKMVAIMFIPAVQLKLLDLYYLKNLEYILMVFFAQILLAIQSYESEYMSRFAFSLKSLVNQQREIINMDVSDVIFAIRLNERSLNFELEFSNKEFQKQYFIEDQNGLKEFMRYQVQVENKLYPSGDLSNVQKSQEGCDKKQQYKLTKTLEEFAYGLIGQKDETEQQVMGLYKNLNTQEKITISFKKMQYSQPLLIILIKQEQVIKQIKQHRKQIQYYINIISMMISQLSDYHEQLYHYLMKHFNIKRFQNLLLPIFCINLSVMNLMKNYLIIINSEKIKSQRHMLKFENFHKYFNNLNVFLQILAKENKLKLNQFNFTNENLSILTQTKFLTQIIINLYELSIENSISMTPITLKIIEIQNYDQENQSVVQFEFSFLSSIKIDLASKSKSILNPQMFEDFANHNQNELDIRYPVTNLLLGILGPRNQITVNQSEYSEFENSNTLILNSITFQIYQDLSLMNHSYVNFIKHIQLSQ